MNNPIRQLRAVLVATLVCVSASITTPHPANAGVFGQTWIQWYAHSTDKGVYLSMMSRDKNYDALYFVQDGKVKLVTTSETKAGRGAWAAKTVGTQFAGSGGLKVWGTQVIGMVNVQSVGGDSGTAIWTFSGASSSRITLNSSHLLLRPLGQSAGHGYWLQGASHDGPVQLMHGTATVAPSEIANDAGISWMGNSRMNPNGFNVFDAGAGSLLVAPTPGPSGCEQQLVQISSSGSTLAPICAPFNVYWQEYYWFQGRIFGPSGLTFESGVAGRWIPSDDSGTPLIIVSQPKVVGRKVFFFARTSESAPIAFYAWDGVSSRLVNYFDLWGYNTGLPLAYVGEQPFLARIPNCDGSACEKNRTFDIMDFGHQPAVKVASGTVGWSNYYDDPKLPYCRACGGMAGFGSLKGQLYFSKLGTSGVELYRWNPKTKKTSLFKNIRSGSKSSFPYGFNVIGGWMYFYADSDGRNGPELWGTDGAIVKKLLEGF